MRKIPRPTGIPAFSPILESDEEWWVEVVFLSKVISVNTGPDFIIGRSFSFSLLVEEEVVFAIMNSVNRVPFLVPLLSR